MRPCSPKSTSRPYPLGGLVFCVSCGRRMHGQTRGGARRYYRCAARKRYPGIADAHARDVLVAEQPILSALEEWLNELFAPERAVETAEEIVAASAQGPNRGQQIEAARGRVSAARREVERCRTALRDAGSEPARRESSPWLDEAAAEKEQADAAVKAAVELAPPTLSVEEVLAVVERCGGLAGVLDVATDTERVALYTSMGVSAVYNPDRNEVRLGVDPVASTVCRRTVRHRHYTSRAATPLVRCRGSATMTRPTASSSPRRGTARRSRVAPGTFAHMRPCSLPYALGCPGLFRRLQSVCRSGGQRRRDVLEAARCSRTRSRLVGVLKPRCRCPFLRSGPRRTGRRAARSRRSDPSSCSS